jgi:hypothetical protein
MSTPVEPIEQFISLGLLLIQASVDFAGNMPDERPVEDVMNDIRRLKTISVALVSALEQAERRIFQPVTFQASSAVRKVA